LFDAYRQLRDGAASAVTAETLRRTEEEASARLADALFIITGKLEQATRALAERPLN
jgi:NAD-dependent DNA ligase